MACGYSRAGVHDREAAFHLLFRDHPFGGEFTIACGLAAAISSADRTMHNCKPNEQRTTRDRRSGWIV
jgi:hypothetical protein